jgi:hypothetical protein
MTATKKYSGPGYEDICMYCERGIRMMHGNWVHTKPPATGRCPESVAAGNGWAAPRPVKKK